MTDIPERKTLSPSEAQALLKNGAIQLIDVREPSEFAAGRIPSARLVPLASLEKAAREWPRKTAVLLYCQSGRRSGQALARLVREGFSQVSDIAGGISTWSAAGLPLEKSAWREVKEGLG